MGPAEEGVEDMLELGELNQAKEEMVEYEVVNRELAHPQEAAERQAVHGERKVAHRERLEVHGVLVRVKAPAGCVLPNRHLSVLRGEQLATSRRNKQ